MFPAFESSTGSPFLYFCSAIFALAILHTLSVNWIHKWARQLDIRAHGKERSFGVQILYFLSEVEVVFGFWVIPLFIGFGLTYGWSAALEYIDSRNYLEPVFVVVIMSLAATRPIVRLSERALRFVARLLGGSLSAWWLSLLTIGPLLGSFITEPGAMAISALLLSRQFYEHQPSPRLAYATLALLFVNISVGGILTHFASPAVLVLAHAWNWDILYMLSTFGWKAASGIALSNFAYWAIFRRELHDLNRRYQLATRVYTPKPEDPEHPIPRWVTLVHLFFIFAVISVSEYPAIFVAVYLFFLAFHHATRIHQSSIQLVRPLLVGFFLSGLVIHGGLQAWWVIQAFQHLEPVHVMFAAMGLTAFNDNTMISYLATLVPNWGALFQYAIFTGVVAGGGLTVIANAPNPAGYVLLSRHFKGGISHWQLFKAALLPTLILYAIFYFFSPL